MGLKNLKEEEQEALSPWEEGGVGLRKVLEEGV